MQRTLLAGSIAVLASCNLVFGNEAPGSTVDAPLFHEDGALFDRCAPIAGDGDPLRYHVLTNPNFHLDDDGNAVPDPWPWEQARTECRRYGMDLAVINDASELGRVGEGWPIWIGQRYEAGAWSAVDNCQPFTNGGTGRAGMACGIIDTALTVTTGSCDGTLPPLDDGTPRLVTFALCEAQRPTTPTCLPKDPATTIYTISAAPMARDAARAYCSDRGAALVEIDSHAEWLRIAPLAADTGHRFWADATFDGAQWQTASACPMLFSWSGNHVDAIAADTCVATTLVENTDEASAGGLRLDGVAPTSCTDATIYALCEQ